MYIGYDKIIGTIELIKGAFENGEGYSGVLPVNTKEGQIGTLYLTKETNEDISYIEWCKENLVQGAGIKIELKELINFLENRATQD